MKLVINIKAIKHLKYQISIDMSFRKENVMEANENRKNLIARKAVNILVILNQLFLNQ
jgi:predicted ABC-type ATPase